jgi:hypothetical protein
MDRCREDGFLRLQVADDFGPFRGLSQQQGVMPHASEIHTLLVEEVDDVGVAVCRSDFHRRLDNRIFEAFRIGNRFQEFDVPRGRGFDEDSDQTVAIHHVSCRQEKRAIAFGREAAAIALSRHVRDPALRFRARCVCNLRSSGLRKMVIHRAVPERMLRTLSGIWPVTALIRPRPSVERPAKLRRRPRSPKFRAGRHCPAENEFAEFPASRNCGARFRPTLPRRFWTGAEIQEYRRAACRPFRPSGKHAASCSAAPFARRCSTELAREAAVS